MPRLIDRVPVPDKEDFVFVGPERVKIHSNEIIVWVSLRVAKVLDWFPDRQPFPAILDTGNTHYFSIQEQHLFRWAGMRPDPHHFLGNTRQSGSDQEFPRYSASLWMHRNVRGKRDDLLDASPHRLELKRGMIVYPDAAKFPRLPLIGLRTILDNNLHLSVDGERKWASLRSTDWRTRLIRWLA